MRRNTMERIVQTGYVKMIAISISDLESEIVDEKNTNYLQDVETFQQRYRTVDNIKCMFLHMDNNYTIEFLDYKKVHPHIHPYDYIRDIIKKERGRLLEHSDNFTVEVHDYPSIYGLKPKEENK